MLLGLLLGSWAGPDKHMRPATIGADKEEDAAAWGGGDLGAPHRAGHNSASGGGQAAGQNLLEAVRQAEVAAGEPLFCRGFLDRPLVDVLLSAPFPSKHACRKACEGQPKRKRGEVDKMNKNVW